VESGRFFGANQVRLLRGGDALFPALIAAIDAARHSVWLASYIFWDDSAAQAIALALTAAARRGVAVRVVVDGFGSHRTLHQVQAWLADAAQVPGAGLVVFRPLERWWSWLQPGQLRRLHQKLCVVDSQVGFVGGINLIDDFNDVNHGYGDTPRLDFAVEVRGPVVVPIEQAVRAVWTRASLGSAWREEVGNLLRSAQPLVQTRRLMRQLRIVPPDHPALESDADLAPVRVALAVRDNLRQRRSIERSYIDAIRFAQHSVDLITPYFYPGRSFRRALNKAARRGVRVRLLLQGKVDYRLAALAARVLYDDMLAHGVEIYEYTPAFLHAKTAVVDGVWATVGSSNIDPLSLLLNLEANLLVRDRDFAAALTVEFERAVEYSRSVTSATRSGGPWAVLRRGFVAWLAHWYLRMAGVNTRY
jgi:cardiolipin synthase